MRLMALCLLTVTSLIVPNVFAANEAVCDAMAANCIASHTYQTPMVVDASNTYNDWVRETDTAGKRCGEGVDSGGNRIMAATKGAISTIFNDPGLPNGRNSMQVFNSGGMGIKGICNSHGELNMTGRIGVRYYVYYSGDYQSTFYEGGVCTNDKQARIGDYLTAYWYGFANSSNPASWQPGPEQLRNKWVRIEFYVNDHQNSTQYEVYWKNLTDNSQEYSATFPARIGLHNQQNPCENPNDPNTCHWPQNKQDIWMQDGYREGNCAGYRRYAYAIFARLQPGERIQPAIEVEGGIVFPPVDTVPPAAPIGIQVTQLWAWITAQVAALWDLLGPAAAHAETARHDQLMIHWSHPAGIPIPSTIELSLAGFWLPHEIVVGQFSSQLGQHVYPLPVLPSDADRWACARARYLLPTGGFSGYSLPGCNQVKPGAMVSLPPVPPPDPDPIPEPVPEPPPPPDYLRVSEVGDQVLIECDAALYGSMKTTGRGLKRIVACIRK